MTAADGDCDEREGLDGSWAAREFLLDDGEGAGTDVEGAVGVSATRRSTGE